LTAQNKGNKRAETIFIWMLLESREDEPDHHSIDWFFHLNAVVIDLAMSSSHFLTGWMFHFSLSFWEHPSCDGISRRLVA
jgi:hypothetical protein